MKIFLTGGTGFIGKNFCNLVAKKGDFVYAVSRKKRINTQKNIKWLCGDFSDDWSKELSKSDLLVHFAAAGVNQNNKKEIFNTNIFKSIKLLENSSFIFAGPGSPSYASKLWYGNEFEQILNE